MTDPKTPPWMLWLRPALGGMAATAVIGGAIAIWAWHAGQLETVDLASILVLCGVIAAVATGTALTYTPGPIPKGPMLAAGERSLSWRLANNVVLGLLWTGWGTMKAMRAFSEGDAARGYVFVALVLLWLYLSPAMLMGWAGEKRPAGPDPDAELNRAFRARATATGFWTLLACGALAYLISLRTPDILPYLLPFGLWLGGSVACIHFVWLHRQADRDLDDDG